MRTVLSCWAVATALAAAAPARADDACCVQGDAKPWSLYGKGVKWRAELGLDPTPGRKEARAAVEKTGGLSLAERADAVDASLKVSSKDGWKEALKPVAEAARKENRLILFFQLVGDLKLEGC